MSADEPLVLGIETSCDETGVGLVRGTTLLADAIASSVDEHARFGGVVPEVASRAHLDAMVPTIRRACEVAGVTLQDVDAIAVAPRSQGNGLGRELLEALVAEAVGRGCAQLFLEVRVDNDRAISLYERTGFERQGRRANYYGDGVDALILRRRLGTVGSAVEMRR